MRAALAAAAAAAGGITSRSAFVKLVAGETLDVRVLVDRSVVECIVNDGRAAFVTTALNYSASKAEVALFNRGATGQANASSVWVFGMGCAWTSAKPAAARV